MFSSGKLWKENRTFALNSLRELGFGNSSIEIRIKEEVSSFLEHVKLQHGDSFDPHFILKASTCNIICSLINGSRYNTDDAEFQELISIMEHNSLVSGNVGILKTFPILKCLPFDLFKMKKFEKYTHQFVAMQQRILLGHVTDSSCGDNNNLIAAFLKKRGTLNKGVFEGKRQELFITN